MDLETSTTGEKTKTIEKSARLPYSPSWVDRLLSWVDRLPLPAWTFYLSLWLLLFILESGSKWLDGLQPLGKLRWIYIFYPLYGVYFLAAIHHLNNMARKVFTRFQPALAASEVEKQRLIYQLTTMPAQTVWLLTAATLIGVIILLQPVILPLWKSVGITYEATPSFSKIVDLGLITSLNMLILVIFVYHTVRQLSWISKIHNRSTNIDIFQLRPLYSLSRLTARTALILLVVGYLINLNNRLVAAERHLLNIEAFQISRSFTMVSMGFFSVLAVAVFLLPLLSLHRLLLDEKDRLMAEVNSRLQAHVQDMHQRLDSGLLEDADAINKYMSSLTMEREIIAKLPTWPWQPGSLNLLLTAVLLPILLWIVQQLLARWVNF